MIRKYSNNDIFTFIIETEIENKFLKYYYICIIIVCIIIINIYINVIIYVYKCYNII